MSAQTHPLIRIVEAWDRRDRARHTLLWLPRALALALTGAALIALAARLRPLLTDAQIVAAAVTALLIATVVVLVRAWARRPPLIDRARQFDQTFALDEQVSTALAIDAGQIALPDWWRARQGDAAAQAAADAAARLKQVVPLPFDWRAWLIAALPALLLIALLLLPNPIDGVTIDPAQAAAIANAAADLNALADAAANDPTLSAEARADALNALRRSAQALSDPDTPPERAISQLNETSADLRAQADAAGERAAAAQQALQRAADALRAAGQSDSAPAPRADAAAAAAAARESLDALGERADRMTPEERAAAAEALRNAADALAQPRQPGTAGQSTPGERAADALRNAADALTGENPAGARDSLREAAREVGETARQSEADVASQGSLDRLAEQTRQSASEIARAGDAGQGAQQGERGAPSPGEGDMAGAEGEDASAAADGNAAAGQSAGEPSGAGEGAGEPGSRTDAAGAGSNSAGDGAGGAGSDFQSGVSQRGQGGEAGNSPDGVGERPFAPVNVPRAFAMPRGTTAIELAADPGARMTGSGDFADNPTGTISVPYQEVFQVYRGAVDQALDSGNVPLALRDVVRGYFTSLDPGR
jgi:uncharacterized membrane protein